jgi:hypothetical protein
MSDPKETERSDGDLTSQALSALVRLLARQAVREGAAESTQHSGGGTPPALGGVQ